MIRYNRDAIDVYSRKVDKRMRVKMWLGVGTLKAAFIDLILRSGPLQVVILMHTLKARNNISIFLNLVSIPFTHSNVNVC